MTAPNAHENHGKHFLARVPPEDLINLMHESIKQFRCPVSLTISDNTPNYDVYRYTTRRYRLELHMEGPHSEKQLRELLAFAEDNGVNIDIGDTVRMGFPNVVYEEIRV